MRFGVVEGRLGPVDLARDPVDERDVRPGRLEIEKDLRVDVRDLVRPPEAREVATRERRRLRTVGDTSQGDDEHRPRELRAGGDPKLWFCHPGSLRATRQEARRRTPER